MENKRRSRRRNRRRRRGKRKRSRKTRRRRSTLWVSSPDKLVEPVYAGTSCRRPKAFVSVIVEHRAAWFTAAVEEHATAGAGRVQVAVTTMLPVAVRTIVAVEDSARSGRATWLYREQCHAVKTYLYSFWKLQFPVLISRNCIKILYSNNVAVLGL